MGGIKAGPQKAGLGSLRFPRILRKLWCFGGRFCRMFHIVKGLLKKGSAELWEPSPALRPCFFFYQEKALGGNSEKVKIFLEGAKKCAKVLK